MMVNIKMIICREGAVVEAFSANVGVRELQKEDRVGAKYSTFEALEPGQQMEIINDHELKAIVVYGNIKLS